MGHGTAEPLLVDGESSAAAVVRPSRLAHGLHCRCAAWNTSEAFNWCFPSAGGELVLDGGLLTALAPAWRRLRRLVFRGCVLLGAQAAQQLAPFKELQASDWYTTHICMPDNYISCSSAQGVAFNVDAVVRICVHAA